MTARFTGALLLAIAAWVPATAALQSPRAEAPRIKLGTATFRPAAGESPPIPSALSLAGYPVGQRGYYVVQSTGPVTARWKVAIEAQGAELLDYVPDFAFKVRMTPAQASRVQQLADVAWVGVFQPAFKFSPTLRRANAGGYVVTIERGADVPGAAGEVAATGARVLGREGRILRVFAQPAQVEALARVLDVASIENYHVPVKHNEYGGGRIMGASAAHAAGFTGSGQIVAVADTGLGDGTVAGAHGDLPATRVAAIHNWPGTGGGLCFSTIFDDGARDVDTGHGTHTTLSALGGGGVSGEGRGTAPGARLVFQAVENWVVTSSFCKLFLGLPDGYYLIGLPADLGLLYDQAYAGGARVHSNSWGIGADAAYSAESAGTDSFIWSRRDLTITFSAGNAGADANADGVVDSGSLSAPATAKNVIAVGASENDRETQWDCDPALSYTVCFAQGGQNVIGNYGVMFGFPANPLKDDLSAGNAGQMAPFSSRGPTTDGRIKPDVVAPGTWVLSGYATPFQQQYDPSPNPQTGTWQYDGWGFPRSDTYKYLGGTSMSNPLVAGAAAVVRDFYQQTTGRSATAALVKATLINTATDLPDENNDGFDDNDFPIPNAHEGWGRVNVAAAVDGSLVARDESAGLSTGDAATFSYTVGTAGAPFKATLVWSDYPGTANALTALVNDLDLVVTAPDGTTYSGNAFSGGWSVAGGAADRVNNVENVYVAAAATGTWTVQVRGYNVPAGAQPFALVVDGASGSTEPPPPPAAPTALAAVALSETRVDLAWSDNSPDETGFQIERCTGSGCTAFAPFAQVAANVATLSDTSVVASTTYMYRVRAFNSNGPSSYSNTASATTPTPPPPPPPAPPSNLAATALSQSRIDLTWSDNSPDETGFQVERCTGSGCTGFAPLGQTSANVASFSDGSVAASTAYSYRVRAFNGNGPSTYSNTASATTPSAPPPSSTLHVGDLDGERASGTKGTWSAAASVTVHGENHGGVAAATVTGSWSDGTSAACLTNASGTCRVPSPSIHNSIKSTTFTITSIVHATLSYSPPANHDPDGDSNGTAIVIRK